MKSRRPVKTQASESVSEKSTRTEVENAILREIQHFRERLSSMIAETRFGKLFSIETLPIEPGCTAIHCELSRSENEAPQTLA